jgi:hypothetical protein
VLARERQRVSLESQGPSRLSGTHRGVMAADGTGARPSSPVNATAASVVSCAVECSICAVGPPDDLIAAPAVVV